MVWRCKLTFYRDSEFCLGTLEAVGLLHSWRETFLVAQRHEWTRACLLGATQQSKSITSCFSLPCSQGKRPWISSLMWLWGSQRLTSPWVCGRARDLPWLVWAHVFANTLLMVRAFCQACASCGSLSQCTPAMGLEVKDSYFNSLLPTCCSTVAITHSNCKA